MSSVFPPRILVATDGSDESRRALSMGMELSQQMGAEVHVLYVGLLSPWVHPDTLSPEQYKTLKAQAQQQLDEEVAFAEEEGGSVTEAHLRMGKADAEIITLAEEMNVGLVLIGSRGKGTIERILLGDDAESVVRHAPCSVMVARAC